MTTTANKGGLRAAATERRNKHAQRTPLPRKLTVEICDEIAKEVLEAPAEAETLSGLRTELTAEFKAPQYGTMSVTELKDVARSLGVKPLPRTKGPLLEAILKVERAEAKVDQQLTPDPVEVAIDTAFEAPSVAVETPEPAKATSAKAGGPAGAGTKSAGKAEKFARDVASLGWVTEFIHDGEQTESISRRGEEETIYQRWVEGVYQHPATYSFHEWTVQIRNASAGRKRAALPPEQGSKDRDRVAGNKTFKKRAPKVGGATVKLPFDVKLATDAEVTEALRGRGVTWFNSLSNGTESAIVNRDVARIEIKSMFGGDRLVKFCCPITGYRAFRLSALQRVAKSDAKPTSRRQKVSKQVAESTGEAVAA